MTTVSDEDLEDALRDTFEDDTFDEDAFNEAMALDDAAEDQEE